MRWAWRIGTFSGVDVYLHATFLLLPLGAFWFSWHTEQDLGNALLGVVFLLLLFLCVALHEFGHALAARVYGIRTRDITLYPIGGIARLDRIPRVPAQELMIALAGPAVNAVIAGALALGIWAQRHLFHLPDPPLAGATLLAEVLGANLMLLLFNLVPAFPMDGGRILRALLARRMHYDRATLLAATVGQTLAVLFAVLAPWQFGPLMLLVAAFVYLGAAQEASFVRAEASCRGVPARRAMMTEFAALSPDDSLGHAGEQLLAGAQTEFPVVAGGRVVGMLSRADLMHAVQHAGCCGLIRDAMTRAPRPAAAGDSLERVFRRMQQNDMRAVPVLERGCLVGLITLENINELLQLQAALHQARPEGSAAPAEPGPAVVDAGILAQGQPGGRLFSSRRRA